MATRQKLPPEAPPLPVDVDSNFDSPGREARDAGYGPGTGGRRGLVGSARLLARRLRRVVLLAMYLVRHALGSWIGRRPGAIGRAGESVMVPAAVLGLCWYANPANPFFFGEPFPWPWLGPWLIALRYGVLWSVAATFGLLGAYMAFAHQPEFPRLYFLGGAITALVAGEFASYWRMRILRLQEGLGYLGDKAERLTRRLYLLKLSHDELEYELVDRPGTLREALTDLGKMLDRMTLRTPHIPGDLPGAQLVLDFVVNHCRVESAAMYRVDPHGNLDMAAKTGPMSTPDPKDPMIVRALESGHQVHLQDALLEKVQRTSLVAATPLTAADGSILGIMLIGDMPFKALTAENLQTVAVLLESYADYLRATNNAGHLLQAWPGAPREMSSEFAWLSRMRDEHGLESFGVVWRVRCLDAREILRTIISLHSRGESAWLWPPGGSDDPKSACVIALVPFTDDAGLRIYRRRVIDSVLQSSEHVSAGQVESEHLPLEGARAFARLRTIVEGPRVAGEAAPAQGGGAGTGGEDAHKPDEGVFT